MTAAVSLFSGIGALDLAVAEVFGAHPVAFAELDPNASKVLAARWPGVPNLGDVTAADWSAFDDVEVVHGGPPCQPFSAAGRRAGMADERWMWPAMERAVRMVRPRYVVMENVPPLVASDAWGVIVSDLAALGYVGSWVCLRASDVGACHRRERVFLLAADARRTGRPEAAGRAPTEEGGERGGRGHHVADRALAAVRDNGRVVEQAPADAYELGRGRRPAVPGRLLLADGEAPSPDTDSDGREGVGAGWGARDHAYRRDGEGVPTWGDYAPAIARHARLIGRPAPAPVDERGRLSARFVEWMQCLDAGWVTDVLPRNPALKALGNCVVPPCAVAALRMLRARLEAGVAA